MNETSGNFFKEVIQRNKYQFLAACFAFALTVIGAYVGLQLFEQSTTFQIHALQNDVTDIKSTLSGQPANTLDIKVLQTQMNTVIDNQKTEVIDIKDIKNFLLEKK